MEKKVLFRTVAKGTAPSRSKILPERAASMLQTASKRKPIAQGQFSVGEWKITEAASAIRMLLAQLLRQDS